MDIKGFGHGAARVASLVCALGLFGAVAAHGESESSDVAAAPGAVRLELAPIAGATGPAAAGCAFLPDDYSTDQNFVEGNYTFISVFSGGGNDPQVVGGELRINTFNGKSTFGTSAFVWNGCEQLVNVGDRASVEVRFDGGPLAAGSTHIGLYVTDTLGPGGNSQEVNMGRLGDDSYVMQIVDLVTIPLDGVPGGNSLLTIDVVAAPGDSLDMIATLSGSGFTTVSQLFSVAAPVLYFGPIAFDTDGTNGAHDNLDFTAGAALTATPTDDGYVGDEDPFDGVWDIINTGAQITTDLNPKVPLEYRGVAEFDISSIPPGSTITSAALVLYSAGGFFDGPSRLHGYAGNGIVDAGDGDEINPLLDFMPTEIVDDPNFLPVPVSFVQGLVDSGEPFAGFMIQILGDFDFFEYRSVENANPGLRPVLLVDHELDISVLHVDDDAGPGGNGLSWETAYEHLADALAVAAAQPGCAVEVRVAGGFYQPDRSEAFPGGSGDVDATFTMCGDMQILGGYLGLDAGKGDDPDTRDPDLYPTIFSGDLLGDDGVTFAGYAENSKHVITALDTTAAAVLDGVTVRSGNAVETDNPQGGGLLADGKTSDLTISNCRFLSNRSGVVDGGQGGGVRVFGAAVIIDCHFQGNRSANGGGALAIIGGSPQVLNCTFTSNDVIGPAAGNVSAGGAIVVFFSENAVISGCTFTGNLATSTAKGDFGGAGGAIALNGTDFTIVENCQFSGNVCTAVGGAIFTQSSEGDRFVNCAIENNSVVTAPAGFAQGGGVYVNFGSDLEFINCVLDGNAAAQFGGGIVVSSSSETSMLNCRVTFNSTPGFGGGLHTLSNAVLEVINATIAGNSSNEGGGGAFAAESSTIACRNSILWGNVDSDGMLESSQISGDPLAVTSITYCDVQNLTGDLGGLGNIDADPHFINRLGGDFHLAAGSPAAGAGHNWGVPIDTGDFDADGVTTELFPVDLDLNPRISADDDMFGVGCGEPFKVDMGAYERQFDPLENVIFADLDGDGLVNIVDLLGLLSGWGDAEGTCIADLDLSGTVDIVDLLLLLSNWSP